jgi:glycosyltransferase involved in cell wall biosynthesis
MNRQLKAIFVNFCLRLGRIRSARFAGFWRRLDRHFSFDYQHWRLHQEPKVIAQFSTEMSGKAKFSVIIPTYGIALPYINELLASLKAQTYQNFEICIADDADPLSEVAEYLQSLSNTDDNIKYVRHQTNQGIAKATKTALGLMSGDVAVFIDADDTLHPSALDLLARRFAVSEDIEMVYTDHDLMSDGGFRRDPTFKPTWSPELLIQYNYINHLTAVRMSLLERIPRLFDGDYSGSQDWHFCFQVAALSKRVSHIPVPLYHWRARPGSIASGDPSAKPWVHQAGIKARLAYLRTLSPLLSLSKSNLEGKTHSEPILDEAQMTVWPNLWIVSTKHYDLRDEPTDYPSRLTKQINASSIGEILENDQIKAEDVILFHLDSKAKIKGGILSSIAYSLIPRVATVAPFLGMGVRRSYTYRDEELVPISTQRGSFSHVTGNVLCSPLHGSLVRKQVLQEIWRSIESDGTAIAPLEDELGALIGLMGLALGYRNVACKTLEIHQPCLYKGRYSEQINEIVGDRVPKVDPYY